MYLGYLRHLLYINVGGLSTSKRVGYVEVLHVALMSPSDELSTLFVDDVEFVLFSEVLLLVDVYCKLVFFKNVLDDFFAFEAFDEFFIYDFASYLLLFHL
jgi:hypothetical protein